MAARRQAIEEDLEADRQLGILTGSRGQLVPHDRVGALPRSGGLGRLGGVGQHRVEAVECDRAVTVERQGVERDEQGVHAFPGQVGLHDVTRRAHRRARVDRHVGHAHPTVEQTADLRGAVGGADQPQVQHPSSSSLPQRFSAGSQQGQILPARAPLSGSVAAAPWATSRGLLLARIFASLWHCDLAATSRPEPA
jgi:hypothetical protein